MAKDEPPEGYVQCVMDMEAAAHRWVRAHPFAGPLEFTGFERDLARKYGVPEGERVAILAPLSDVVDRWAANEDTRSFLNALVEASHGEATFMQARVLIETAIGHMLERGSGQLPPGDWACTSCGEVQDGFTHLDGKPGAPGPGAVSVCWSCGAIQRVNALGNAYEPVSTSELNRWPKSLRKALCALRAGVQKKRAREKGAS